MLRYNPDVPQKSHFLKSSAKNTFVKSVLATYPYFDEHNIMDDLVPKKESVTVIKSSFYFNCETNRSIDVIKYQDHFLFFKKDEIWLPTLRLVHKYPAMIKSISVDEGAIPRILNSANVMCPGIIKSQPYFKDYEVDEPVSIYGKDKTYAMAVGTMSMSSSEIKSVNKGIGIYVHHILGDGLWNYEIKK
ncbi:Translation machinery-associated protein 20 [Thelohanellus kitauei]|uniref:Translation machinery-associated protein 20 n=1 Tax=Thelohanellus kitauei TaxID=669202 RepID=A0A0C2M2W1_THEKT|nr:Translation machinery-associated protein 20 [Thelohanellus kitauei]